VESPVEATPVRIRPLADDDTLHFADFCCGGDEDDQDFADFLRDDALRLQALKFATTYVAIAGDRLIGYVTLLTDAVRLKPAERKKLKTGDVRGSGQDHPVIPAVKVARLAVSKDQQGRGLGMRLLKWALLVATGVSESAGCRLLTLDALPLRVDYYKRRGFVLNLDEAYEGKDRPSMRFDIFQPDPPPWASR